MTTEGKKTYYTTCSLKTKGSNLYKLKVNKILKSDTWKNIGRLLEQELDLWIFYSLPFLHYF